MLKPVRLLPVLVLVLAFVAGDAAHAAVTPGYVPSQRAGQEAFRTESRDLPSPTKGVAPIARVQASWPRVSPLKRKFRFLPTAALPSRSRTRAMRAVVAGAQPRAVGNPSPVATTGQQVPIAPGRFQLGKVVPRPRPGMTVTLTGQSSDDVDGTIVAWDWTIDREIGGASAPLQASGPIVEVPTDATTTSISARLTVTDSDGNKATSSLRTPVQFNQPPMLSLDRFKKIMKTVDANHDHLADIVTGSTSFVFTPEILGAGVGGPPLIAGFKAEQGFPTTVFANAHDADGEVVDYSYDVDDTANDFERQAGATDELRYVPPFTGDPADTTKVLRVRVTDDEGATSVAELPVTVKLPCTDTADPQEIAPNVRVWSLTGCLTPPADAGGPGDAKIMRLLNGTLSINGLEISASAAKVIWFPTSGRTYVKSSQASVTAVDATGARLYLKQGALAWKVTDGIVKDMSFQGATIGGLEIPGIDGIPTMKNGTFSVKLRPATPAVFNKGQKSTPTEATTFTPITPAPKAKGAAPAGAFSYGKTDLDVGGVALKDAYIEFDGDDTWRFGGKADFELVEITAEGSIIDGDFGRLHGAAAFSGSGFPTGTGVNLNLVDFEMQRADPKPTTCVPHMGKELISLQALRDMLISYGSSAAAVNKHIPDFEYDYKYPDFQLCGRVKFNVPKILGGDVSIGYRTYPDNTKVFGVTGKLDLLSIPVDILFESYNDGYLHLSADANFKFDGGKITANGGIDLEARTQGKEKGKYNALVYADVCVKYGINSCVGGTLLASSRGIGACLGIDTFVGEWTPGVTWVYGGAVTPYFQGCDVGDVEEQIKDGGNVTVTAVPAPGAKAKARAAASQPFTPGQVVPYRVASAVPGVVASVSGVGGLAHFTVVDPTGKRYEATAVDDNAQRRITRADEQSHVFKAPASSTTNVMIRGTTHVRGLAPVVPAGPWKLEIAQDSVPVSAIRWSNGVQKPRAAGTFTRGSDGRLSFALTLADSRAGIVARVLDDGPTGAQRIASIPLVKGKVAKRTIRFASSGTRSGEPRELRVFFERNGIPVGSTTVSRYRAPTPPAPRSVGNLKVNPAGKTILASWAKVPLATSYRVILRFDDGRQIIKNVRTNALKAPVSLRTYDKVTVTVTPVSGIGRRGKTTSAVLARRAPRPELKISARGQKELAQLAKLAS